MLYAEENKVEEFGYTLQQFAYWQHNQAPKEKNTLSAVEHSGSAIMMWGCCAASGAGT